MWGGLDFFVSLDVLVSFTVPPHLLSAAPATNTNAPSPSLTHCPGNPVVRRLEFSRERRLTPLLVYPNATLFLQVLFSSGNRVHLLTPWSKEDTSTILKACEWGTYLADARRIAVVPGTREFSFASLGVEPAAYTRTVLVVDDAARWSCATSLQTIEVDHCREGGDGFRSSELLYALSRAVQFAEWMLRYPSSSIASCVALCNTAIFAYCRFCFRGAVLDAQLMLLVSNHGGRIVSQEGEATHVVVVTAAVDAPMPSSSSSSSSSSTSSDSDDSSDSTSDTDVSAVDSSDGDSDHHDDEEGKEARKKQEANVRVMSDGKTGSVLSRGPVSGSETLPSSAKNVSQVQHFSAAPAQAGTAPSSTTAPTTTSAQGVSTVLSQTSGAATSSSASSPVALVVTPLWVRRCIRALRMVPLEEEDEMEGSASLTKNTNEEAAEATAAKSEMEHEQKRGDDAERLQNAQKRKDTKEMAQKSRLLLCCLLPPADARPLLWTTFQSIARQHGYDLTCFSPSSALSNTDEPYHPPTAAAVLDALTSPVFTDVIEVRLLDPPHAAGKVGTSTTARSRSTVVTRATRPTLRLSSATGELARIAVSRSERRRDKEAVFSHLQLVASQFLYSYDYVRRQRLQALHHDAGTQTSGPRHASVGVMTDPEELAKKLVEAETMGAAQTKGTPPSPQSLKGANAVATSEAEGSVEVEEWRHHLRNVEGKLLVSQEHQQTRVGDMAAAAQVKHDRSTGGSGSILTFHEDLHSDKDAKIANGGASEAQGTAPDDVPSKSEKTDPTSSHSPLKQTTASLMSAPPPFVSSPSHDQKSDADPSFSSTAFFSTPAQDDGFTNPSSPVRRPTETAATYTACFIPTTALTDVQQEDFVMELRSYPIFSSPELGNRALLLPDGVKCEFPSHKAAEDFCRIDFIEFLSLHLPIYPYFDYANTVTGDDVPLPQQQDERLFMPAVTPATARNAGQESVSLWKAPSSGADTRVTTSSPHPPPQRPEYGHRSEAAQNTAEVASEDMQRHRRRHPSKEEERDCLTDVPPYRSFTATPGSSSSAEGSTAPLPSGWKRPHEYVERTLRRRSPEKRRRDDGIAEEERRDERRNRPRTAESGGGGRRSERPHRDSDDDVDGPRDYRSSRHSRSSSHSGDRSSRYGRSRNYGEQRGHRGPLSDRRDDYH